MANYSVSFEPGGDNQIHFTLTNFEPLFDGEIPECISDAGVHLTIQEKESYSVEGDSLQLYVHDCKAHTDHELISQNAYDELVEDDNIDMTKVYFAHKDSQ